MENYKSCVFRPLWCKYLHESDLFCTNGCIIKNLIPACEDGNDYRFINREINVAHVIVEKSKYFPYFIFIKVEQNELNKMMRKSQFVINDEAIKYFKKYTSGLEDISMHMAGVAEQQGFLCLSKDVFYNKLYKFINKIS